jgi:hypothetical protein
MAAKKLKNYFEEHPIKVVCTMPLLEIIGNKDAIGRVAKWVIELAAHTIQYEPRHPSSPKCWPISSLIGQKISTYRQF